MTTLSFFYLFSFSACIVGGAVVIARGPRLPVNLSFGWLSVWLAYWAFVHLCRASAISREQAAIFVLLGEAWPFVVSAALLFVVVLSDRLHLLRRWWVWGVIYLPAVVFTSGLLWGFDAEPVRYDWGWSRNVPSSHAFFELLDVWTIACSAIVVAIVVHSALVAKDRLKRGQMRTLLAGIAVGVLGVFGETMVSRFGPSLPGLSAIFIGIGYTFLGYGIWRYDVFSLTPASVAERLIDLMPDMLFLVSFDGTIIRANTAALATLGLSRGEVEGGPWTVFLDESSAIVAWLSSASQQKGRGADTLIDEDAVITARGGLSIPVSFSATILRSDDGILRGALLIARDMRERKTDEARTRELERRILESEKAEALGRMAGGVAHDFNNLLSAIIGNATLALDEDDVPGPIRELLQDIEEASRRAAFLSTQMLHYAGKRSLSLEEIDLSELARDVTAEAADGTHDGVRIVFDLEDNLPSVRGSRRDLSQVIAAVTQNAVEALENGEGVVTLRSGITSVEETDGSGCVSERPMVSLEIEDDGCGMDEQALKKMFEPFYTTKFTGRGLELAAALGIIRSHGGLIKAHSEKGAGTRVSMLLPLQSVDEAVARSSDNVSTRVGKRP